jgi:hypothetical protein
MNDIPAEINSVETGLDWGSKIDKVVWRGTPCFDPLSHVTFCSSLFSVTHNVDPKGIARDQRRSVIGAGI